MALQADTTPDIPDGTQDGAGVVQINAASPLILFNGASQTQTTSYDNVTSVLAGSDANIYPVKIAKGCAYLAIYHAWLLESASAPVIRVYREMPRHPTKRHYEDNVIPFLGSNNATDEKNRRYFVPASDLKTGATSLTIGTTTPAMKTTVGANTWQISAPTLIDMLGASRAIVVIETAMTGPSGVSPTGKIVGHFGW